MHLSFSKIFDFLTSFRTCLGVWAKKIIPNMIFDVRFLVESDPFVRKIQKN